MYYGPKNSIIIAGDGGNLEKLSSNAALAEAGLEVKNNAKLNPRLIIHSIPVIYDGEMIQKALIKQNFPDCAVADFKIVHLYPARDKKHRSCIIETPSVIRKKLIDSERVFIGNTSCRIVDYVSITQCYKCADFGHIADKCTNSAPVCSFCAGSHSSNECNSKKSLCCINCKNASYSKCSHSAFDRDKCPILRDRIKRKTAIIDYE